MLRRTWQRNEAEWLTSEAPEKMLGHMGCEASDRKCRLFMAACCRVWHAFDGEEDSGRQDAIVVAERHADGLADDELDGAFGELTDGALHRTWDCCTNLAVASFDEPGDAATYAAGAVEEAVHRGFLLAAGYYRDDPGNTSGVFECDRSQEGKIDPRRGSYACTAPHTPAPTISTRSRRARAVPFCVNSRGSRRWRVASSAAWRRRAGAR